MKKYIIFDADDTLWETSKKLEIVVKDIISAYYSILNYENFTISELEIEEFLRQKDINKLIHSTFNYEFISKFLVLNYTTLCLKQVKRYNAQVEKEIYNIIFKTLCSPILYKDTEEYLNKLSKEYTLYLYTHGEPKIQMKKIDNTGIKNYFEVIEIEQLKKSKENLKNFLKKIKKWGTPFVYYIGDSIKYDINPAINCGLNPILITRGRKIEEKQLLQKVYIVNDFKEAEGALNAYSSNR